MIQENRVFARDDSKTIFIQSAKQPKWSKNMGEHRITVSSVIL